MIQTHHDSPVRTISKSLSNFSAGRMAGLFSRLQGFDQQQVLQFARNLQEDYSIVQGVRIPVTEEYIAQFLGLPTNGIH
jgi:hypothetical protein